MICDIVTPQPVSFVDVKSCPGCPPSWYFHASAMAPNLLFLVPTQQTECANGQDFNGNCSMIAKLPCLKTSDGQIFTLQVVGSFKRF